MKLFLFLALSFVARGQCIHSTTRSPIGVVLVFQNGTLLAPSAYVYTPVLHSFPTISPNLFSAGDVMTAAFSRQVPLSFVFNGTTVNYIGYSTWQETWTCANGNRPASPPPSWFPTLATFAAPPLAPAIGQAFLFTDASATLACAGGGSSAQPCYWTGSGWAPAYPLDNSIFPGPPMVLHGNQCLSGLVDSSAVASNGPVSSWEVPILANMDGATRYTHVIVSEHKRFLGLPDLCVSMGRPGTNDIELTGACAPLEASDSDAAPWTARPAPPQITGGYPVVLNFRTVSGTLDMITQGSVYWEVCGFAAGQIPATSQLASLRSCSGSGTSPATSGGPDWSAQLTYPAGAAVNWAGTSWLSLQAGNIGNQPDTSAPWWRAASWNCNGMYAATFLRPDGTVLPMAGPAMPVPALAPGAVWSSVK